jgi:hypothetical protein
MATWRPFVGTGTGLLLVLSLCLAAFPRVAEVDRVKYLQGMPGHTKKVQGALHIEAQQLAFVTGGKVQFAIDGKHITYVAARAQASIRARTSDVGTSIAGIVGAYPLVFLFHKGEKHLLSIEFTEGKSERRRLVLFNVKGHSSWAVKKIIDDAVGLTPEYYRQRDQEEEAQKRLREADKKPAGQWRATKGTVVGESQYARVLLEEGLYAILILPKYVGFSPGDLEWAKYRIPIREVKSTRNTTEELTPIYEASRLTGFAFKGKKYLFY